LADPPPRSLPTRRSSDLRLLQPPWFADDAGSALRGAALDPVDCLRRCPLPAQYQCRLEEGVQIVAAGIELVGRALHAPDLAQILDRKSTRLNSSHVKISY